jgi:hypothetical protein
VIERNDGIQQGGFNNTNVLLNTGSLVTGQGNGRGLTAQEAIAEFRRAFTAAGDRLPEDARLRTRGELEEIAEHVAAPGADRTRILHRVSRLTAGVAAVSGLADAARALYQTLDQILR